MRKCYRLDKDNGKELIPFTEIKKGDIITMSDVCTNRRGVMQIEVKRLMEVY